MRIESYWALWLLWMSLLWGITPLAIAGLMTLVLRWGFWVIPAAVFAGAVAAAAIVEGLHRRKKSADEAA